MDFVAAEGICVSQAHVKIAFIIGKKLNNTCLSYLLRSP